MVKTEIHTDIPVSVVVPPCIVMNSQYALHGVKNMHKFAEAALSVTSFTQRVDFECLDFECLQWRQEPPAGYAELAKLLFRPYL